MSKITRIEQFYGATNPTQKKCHVYACGGNSILAGTMQYNTSNPPDVGMTSVQKAKYWDVIHTGVYRMQPTLSYMVQEQKIYQPLYTAPETYADAYSSPMVIFPRLRELYSNNIDIAFCMNYLNGTGFKNTDVRNYNVEEADPVYGSLNLVKELGRFLDLTVKHMKAMGYDAEVKGILMIGQSVADVWAFDGESYDAATFKTDLTNVVNYFRNTLGYTNIPFYLSETTQASGDNPALWNQSVLEVNTLLGNINLHYLKEWAVLGDGTHINGESGVNVWGEGVETNGHKNMAELIYSVENPS